MKIYDIFLFDADGTLYDFIKAEANALKIMFEYCGFGYTDSIRTRYREINEPLWRCHEKGEISLDQLQVLRFENLFKDLGVYHDPQDFNTRYLLELGKGSFLIDGALDICREIVSRGKKIFIVTNGLSATQASRIRHSPIRDYISDVFVSEHIGFQKPDKGFFDYVFPRIPQVGKDKILIIGDSLTADIAGGNNAGIDTCWFNQHGVENGTGIAPVYEIRELKQIKQAFL